MSRYLPRFLTQRDPTDPCARFNCVAYSGAMALDYATLGGLLVSGRIVREATNEPRCADALPGLTAAQLVGASRGLYVPLIARLDQSWTEFRGEIEAGCGAVMFIHYGALPASLRSSGTFTGDHAVFVHHRDPAVSRYRVGDPLAATWRWWPGSALKAAAAAFPGPGFDWVRTRDVPELAGL